MSDPVDKRGTVHEKGWDGQYKPKEHWYGKVRDTDWLGNPKVERDFFGNPKAETNWWGQQVRSRDGTPLYRRKSSSTSRSTSSSADDALGSLLGFLIWLAIALALVVLGLLFSLVIVPALRTVWQALQSKRGRIDLAIFLASVAVLGSVAFVSWTVYDTFTNSIFYQIWQRVLCCIQTVVVWSGLIWIILQRPVMRATWHSSSAVLHAHGYYVAAGWRWLWSWV